jgi:hypothetical protein
MFRRRDPGSEPSDNAYDGLRALALGATEDRVGNAPPEHPQVLGAVIDIPGAGGMASVVALADGTTSMYTSTGGGIIGAGAHEAVAVKTHALLTALQRLIEMFPADDRVDLPAADLVQITLITPTGRRRASVPAPAFWGQEPSTVADLIAAIHDVISAIREVGPPDQP